MINQEVVLPTNSVPCSLPWESTETQEKLAEILTGHQVFRSGGGGDRDARQTKRQKSLLLVISNYYQDIRESWTDKPS